MSEHLALPTVLDELERRVGRLNATHDELRQVLVAMQRAGLSRTDIEVHLERLRAVNDATVEDEDVEDNCLLALEMVAGETNDGALSWDADEMASVYVPKVVNLDLAMASLPFALVPNDMIPPRPGASEAPSEQLLQAPQFLVSAFALSEWRPMRSMDVRVPKGPFTTRPAALLAFADRLVFESLAGLVSAALDRSLPAEVVWPRSRHLAPDFDRFRDSPLGWTAPYIIKADIAAFYESIDHSLLAMITGSRLRCTTSEVQAIEYFLTAVMGKHTGLPQGPLASDIFATTYLLVVDTALAERGWQFSRFADDYFIAAESMADGREKLEELEALLTDHHLSLNDSKTMVLRGTTYSKTLNAPPRALTDLHRRIREEKVRRLLHADDREELADELQAAGADEQLLFDVLYHGTTSVEDAIAELGDNLDPADSEVSAAYLQDVQHRLTESSGIESIASLLPAVREAVLRLAAAGDPRGIDAVVEILPWYPALGPLAAAYFTTAPASGVDAGLRLLSNAELPDWTAAWVCRSLLSHEAVQDDERVVRLLRELTASRSAGPLLQMQVIWGLAARGELGWEEWSQAVGASSAAQRAELLLARESDPSRYPPSPITFAGDPPEIGEHD